MTAKTIATLVTLAFLGVDARAWLLSYRDGSEGLWIVMHLALFGLAAGVAWAWVNIETTFDAPPKRGGKVTR